LNKDKFNDLLSLEPGKKKTPSLFPQIQKLLHHVDIHTGGALAPHGRTTSFPVRSSLPCFGSSIAATVYGSGVLALGFSFASARFQCSSVLISHRFSLAASPAVVVGDSVLDFRCCTLFLSAVR
jgi:hypothetical protein